MCFMNKLFEKLNLGRRKAAQSERISARSHFRPISRNSIDTSGGRNRQTLWGGCTDANPKLLLNDT